MSCENRNEYCETADLKVAYDQEEKSLGDPTLTNTLFLIDLSSVFHLQGIDGNDGKDGKPGSPGEPVRKHFINFFPVEAHRATSGLHLQGCLFPDYVGGQEVCLHMPF